MIESTIYWFGLVVLFIGGTLLSIVLIGLLVYWVYKLWLIKILDWNDKKSREELFYFIRHKKQIREYIELKKVNENAENN
jgi:hypothetical protein